MWKTILLGSTLALVSVACQSPATEAPKASLEEQISNVEKAVAATPTKTLRDQLADLYQQQLQDSTLDVTVRLDRHRYLAEASYADGNHVEAYNILRNAIADYPEAKTVPEAALLMAELANVKLREPFTVELIFAVLRQRFASHPALELIPAAYPQRDLDSLRQAAQEAIYGSSGFDREAAIRYGKAAMAYTALINNDSIAIQDHIASARVLEQAKQYNLAIAHYDKVIEGFPNTTKAADAQFLKAFVVYEYQNKEEGMQQLQAFLASHPDHRLAESAKAMLADQ